MRLVVNNMFYIRKVLPFTVYWAITPRQQWFNHFNFCGLDNTFLYIYQTQRQVILFSVAHNSNQSTIHLPWQGDYTVWPSAQTPLHQLNKEAGCSKCFARWVRHCESLLSALGVFTLLLDTYLFWFLPSLAVPCDPIITTMMDLNTNY